MKTTDKITAAAIVVFSAALTGCKKEDTGEAAQGYVAAKMTEARVGNNDTPPAAAFTAVNIDIAAVDVHYSNDHLGTSGWMALHTNAGVYDLLTLQNNVMAAVAEDTPLPAGTITQLRLTLGPRNTVFIGADAGQLLTVPSKEIKVNVNTAIAAGVHHAITLVFDANKSIVVQGNGGFALKPVLEVKCVTSY